MLTATMTSTRAKRLSSIDAAPVDPAAANLARRAEIGEERRMRTRATLIQAAITVLGHEEGRFATVDEIIGKAGVARGTFYNHFEGRDQFLVAVSHELSHAFNAALDSSVGGTADPALRAATWTRSYLRRVRADPPWGWAVVNVGLNGRHLLGEETYNAARRNIAVARKLGTFKVPNAEAALDIGVGVVFAAALTVLRGPTRPDHPEATAYMLLLALGVSPAKAQEIVARPLPTLPGF